MLRMVPLLQILYTHVSNNNIESKCNTFPVPEPFQGLADTSILFYWPMIFFFTVVGITPPSKAVIPLGIVGA